MPNMDDRYLTLSTAYRSAINQGDRPLAEGIAVLANSLGFHFDDNPTMLER